MSNSVLSISNMVTSSVGMCDENIRSDLFNNIIVTGGNSLLQVIFKINLFVKH